MTKKEAQDLRDEVAGLRQEVENLKALLHPWRTNPGYTERYLPNVPYWDTTPYWMRQPGVTISSISTGTTYTEL